MLKKYLSRNLKILSLMVALMALNSHGAATSEEGVPKAPYRLPTLNGTPLEGIQGFAGLKGDDGFFVLEVEVSQYKQAAVTLDEWGIQVGNMQLGQGSTDMVPFLKGVYEDNVVQMRQLKRGGQKVLTEGTYEGGVRAHTFDVRNAKFSNYESIMLDMTRQVRFNCDEVIFKQPVLAICPEDMEVGLMHDGKTRRLKREPLSVDAKLSAIKDSDVFVEGGIALAPVSGKGTWLKGIVVETHPDVTISPYVGLMGRLQFSPPSTKGVDFDGLMAVGARTISFIIGSEDAVWHYEDRSAPFQVEVTEKGISMKAGKGPEDNRYVLSIPKVEEVPGEAQE